MMRDCERERRGNCKTLKVAYGVRTITFNGLWFFSRIFVLLDLSNVEMDGGFEMRLDRRSGVGSKFNTRSGTISLLREILDLCEKGSTDAASEVCETSSTDAASEIFDFCDNLSWDVAAGLLLCSLGEYRIPAKQGLLQFHRNSTTKDLGTLVLSSYFRG